MNREAEKELYLSTDGLMDMLDISRSTVYRLTRRGLPNLMVGGVHRYPMNRVIDWLQAQSGAAVSQGAEGR